MKRWAVVIATVVALVLAGCASATPASSSVGGRTAAQVEHEFAGLGIATVPFAGGAPVVPVAGATTLVLTDWQVRSIAASYPAHGLRPDGVDRALLDKAIDVSDVGDGSTVASASAVVGAWWLHADTAAARSARKALDPLAATGAIPLFVLALFTADVLRDQGYTAAGTPKALGVGHVARASFRDGVADDPCGAVSGAIDTVNQYLDSIGTVGTIISNAISAVGIAIDTATGGLLTLVKRIIAVVNAVMNVASLLTPRTASISTDQAVYDIGVAPGSGSSGTATVRLSGAAAAPGPVQSCLQLVGITSDDNLAGSPLQWSNYGSFWLDTEPGLVVFGQKPTQLGQGSQAALPFTTGVETVDTAHATSHVDDTASAVVQVHRADIDRLGGYLHGIIPGAFASLLGPLVDDVVTAITVAADPQDVSTPIKVRVWTPDDQPKPAKTADAGGHQGSVAGVAGCPDPTAVAFATPQNDVVTKAWSGAGGGGSGQIAGLQSLCGYDTDIGGEIVFAQEEPPSDPSGFDVAMSAILTTGGCGTASGPLTAATGMTVDFGTSSTKYTWPVDGFEYGIWTGTQLDLVGAMPLGGDGELQDLARVAGWC